MKVVGEDRRTGSFRKLWLPQRPLQHINCQKSESEMSAGCLGAVSGILCVALSLRRLPVEFRQMMPEAQVKTFGSLQCRIVREKMDQSPSLIVMLSHGFGAPGTDLVGLAAPFINTPEVPTDRVAFVFPEAPLDLAHLGMPGGRAWWPINMEQLAQMYQTRDFAQLTEVEPDGLQDASAKLASTVEAILEEFQLTQSELFLGGFSQGAMASTDLVLRRGFQPAQLIILSGTMLCRSDWNEMAVSHSGCPVIQTHGTMDMVLPLEPSEWLRDMLVENGFDVRYQQFPGQHEVPMPALELMAAAIAEKMSDATEAH